MAGHQFLNRSLKKREDIERLVRIVFGKDIRVEFGTTDYGRKMRMRITMSDRLGKYTVEYSGNSCFDIGEAVIFTFLRIERTIRSAQLLQNIAKEQENARRAQEAHSDSEPAAAEDVRRRTSEAQAGDDPAYARYYQDGTGEPPERECGQEAPEENQEKG